VVSLSIVVLSHILRFQPSTLYLNLHGNNVAQCVLGLGLGPTTTDADTVFLKGQVSGYSGKRQMSGEGGKCLAFVWRLDSSRCIPCLGTLRSDVHCRPSVSHVTIDHVTS